MHGSSVLVIIAASVVVVVAVAVAAVVVVAVVVVVVRNCRNIYLFVISALAGSSCNLGVLSFLGCFFLLLQQR